MPNLFCGKFAVGENYNLTRDIIGGKEKTVSPDTVLKNYWSGNEEFADLFNAVLFGGSQVTGAYTLCHAAASYGIRLCHL